MSPVSPDPRGPGIQMTGALLFQQQCFSLEPHCSHKMKTKIIIPSIQNQKSLLVKWQTDSIIPGGGGWEVGHGGEEISP